MISTQNILREGLIMWNIGKTHRVGDLDCLMYHHPQVVLAREIYSPCLQVCEMDMIPQDLKKRRDSITPSRAFLDSRKGWAPIRRPWESL